MNAPVRAAAIAAAGLVLLLAACAGGRPAGDSGALAAGGYDVVAYFTEGRAVQGSAAHAATWDGKRWQFASAVHRRMFEAQPGKYVPAYDGHCAWAMSQGRLAQGLPRYWAINEGRLFFNCDAAALENWRENPARLMDAADREWAERTGG